MTLYIQQLQQEQEIQEYIQVLQRLIKQNPYIIDFQLQTDGQYTLQSLQALVSRIFKQGVDSTATKKLNGDIKFSSLSQPYTPQQPFKIMNFIQIFVYKTLPCPNQQNCPFLPREIAPSNQYKECELLCPFYHHDKDKRRITISKNVEEEFIYKANYDKSKCDPFPDKFSQNYFESMFHPIYYKLFSCRRNQCERSSSCPFYHLYEEKLAWDDTFMTYIRKSRDVYTKEKGNQNQMRPNTQFVNNSAKSPNVMVWKQQQQVDQLSTNSSSNSSSGGSPQGSTVNLFENQFPIFGSPKILASPPGLKSILNLPTPNKNFGASKTNIMIPPFFQEPAKIPSYSLFGQVNEQPAPQQDNTTCNLLSQFFNVNMVDKINSVKLQK